MTDKIYDQREDLYEARKAAELDKMRAVKAWDDSAEITRLRAELERVREAGQTLLMWWDNDSSLEIEPFLENLRTALEGEEGK